MIRAKRRSASIVLKYIYMGGTQQPESKEFQRFEELAKKLVSVPKKEIQEQERKAKTKGDKRRAG